MVIPAQDVIRRRVLFADKPDERRNASAQVGKLSVGEARTSGGAEREYAARSETELSRRSLNAGKIIELLLRPKRSAQAHCGDLRRRVGRYTKRLHHRRLHRVDIENPRRAVNRQAILEARTGEKAPVRTLLVTAVKQLGRYTTNQ